MSSITSIKLFLVRSLVLPLFWNTISYFAVTWYIGLCPLYWVCCWAINPQAGVTGALGHTHRALCCQTVGVTNMWQTFIGGSISNLLQNMSRQNFTGWDLGQHIWPTALCDWLLWVHVVNRLSCSVWHYPSLPHYCFNLCWCSNMMCVPHLCICLHGHCARDVGFFTWHFGRREENLNTRKTVSICVYEFLPPLHVTLWCPGHDIRPWISC